MTSKALDGLLGQTHRLRTMRKAGEKDTLSMVLNPTGIIWGTVKNPDAWVLFRGACFNWVRVWPEHQDF